VRSPLFDPNQPDPAPPAVYQLKITLADSEPEVWRRVLVSAAITLGELHEVIQQAMGWQNQHEYRFKRSLDFDPALFSPQQPLSDVLSTLGDWPVYYTYDLVSGWLHRIEAETLEILGGSGGSIENMSLPVCLDGAAACPPEDAGGVWGYDELLARLEDPDDPEYLDLIDRYSDLDPEAFDLAAANARLQQR
jgi:hypothetical protein